MTASVLSDPNIHIVGAGCMHAAGQLVDVPLCAGSACATLPVLACSEPLSSCHVPRSRLRRLGRAQQLAVLACAQALVGHEAAMTQHAAITMGTALGATGETESFLETVLSRGSAAPRPGHFVNSVHNALATQVAMLYGCTGENLTFTHDFLSFELAARHAMQLLRSGRASHVLTCGCDQVSGYLASIGLELGWWTHPDRADGSASRVVAGEGSGALLLSSAATAGGCRLRVVATEPMPHDMRDGSTFAPGKALIDLALAEAGLDAGSLDLLLVGTNGLPAVDAVYEGVLAAFGPHPAFTTLGYKGICGEYCTASAVGTVLAAGLVAGRDDLVPAALRDRLPRSTILRSALVYHAYITGCHTAIVITP